MKIPIFCLTLTAAAVLIALLLWRIRAPRKGITALLIIFTGVLCAGLLSAQMLNRAYGCSPAGFWEFLHVIIFYVPVMLGCIVTYSALEEDSPSMTIVGFVEQAGEKGRSRGQIGQIISDEALILPRIDTLVNTGWIECRDNTYRSTAKGRFYSELLALAPKLLNISREG